MSSARRAAAGRVRVVASGSSSSGSLFSEDVRLRQVAGAFVAVTTTFGDQYASGETTSVVSLRSGRRRTIASFQDDVGASAPTDGTQALAVIVTPGGRVAAAVTDLVSADVRIVAFGSTGPARTLDTGSATDLPASSLTLTGATIRWTHAGAARAAPLP